MRTTIILSVLMLVVLVLSACEQVPVPVVVEDSTAEETSQVQSNACEGPNCCPDQDSDGICDEDESNVPAPQEIVAPKDDSEDDKKETKEESDDEVSVTTTGDLKGVTFEDYPKLLLVNGKPSYKVVIGMDGPSSDVVASVDIVTRITADFNSEPEPGLSVMDVKVNSLSGDNYIVVGSPCWNRKTAELLGLKYPSCGDESGLQKGEPQLRLLPNGNRYIILVLGLDADDVADAAKALAKEDDLEGTTVNV